MKNTRQNKIILFTVIFILLIIAIPLVIQRTKGNSLDTILASNPSEEKQLEDVEILETVNMNSDRPQFKLNVQTHGEFTQIPERLLLVDKVSNSIALQLPLSPSLYPTECVMHRNMNDNMLMKKWETQWFTVDGITQVDATYAPKLSQKYSVHLDYYLNTEQVTFTSKNEITDVCFQIPKSEAISPTEEEYMEE